ncbi:hypothetical protein SGLAM104S_07748 [Streptomyces glaucescens]
MLAAARAEGLTDPVEIQAPADASSAYVVKQVQRSWPEKQDSVAVDPATGEVLDVLRFADYPVLAELTRWGIDLHSGVLFGLVSQIALMLLAGSLILLVLWGYRMWWQRGRGSAFGRPIPRGAWAEVPPQILVPPAGRGRGRGVLRAAAGHPAGRVPGRWTSFLGRSPTGGDGGRTPRSSGSAARGTDHGPGSTGGSRARTSPLPDGSELLEVTGQGGGDPQMLSSLLLPPLTLEGAAEQQPGVVLHRVALDDDPQLGLGAAQLGRVE